MVRSATLRYLLGELASKKLAEFAFRIAQIKDD